MAGSWASFQQSHPTGTCIESVRFLETSWEASTTTDAGWSTQLDVLVGVVCAVKTPGGNYAKLKVASVSGLAGSRSITFQYAFQSTPSLIQF